MQICLLVVEVLLFLVVPNRCNDSSIGETVQLKEIHITCQLPMIIPNLYEGYEESFIKRRCLFLFH